jgi:hypothetical protein
MNIARLFTGALLTAALVFPQGRPGTEPQLRNGELVWFMLQETKQQVAQVLGQPKLTAEFGRDFESWQYQIGDIDHDEFSHQLVFRKASGELVSVARNYEPERNVDDLFPEQQTRVHHYPDAKKPQFSLRLRHLSGGRLLMAMGVSKAGQATGQILLIKESELRHFYPWLSKELETTGFTQ